MKIYSKNGKEIPIKNGTIILPGSMIFKNNKWETLEQKHIVKISRINNSLAQSSYKEFSLEKI